MNTLSLLRFLDFAGVAVYAISGALTAGRKSLDLLGVIVIAIATAVGGGTIRDLLLDRPVFWVGDPRYLIVIIPAALATVAYVRWVRRTPDQVLQIVDAFGLALFSISGAQIAQNTGAGGLIAVVMGTVTGVFGGVMRDVLCGEIPMILRRGNIYATAAIAGTTAYVLLYGWLPRPWPTVIGMGLIAGLRLAAIVWNLTLPVFTLSPDHRR